MSFLNFNIKNLRLFTDKFIIYEVDNNHLEPKYYRYKKGCFANTTICIDCNRIGLYEDQHPANCCSRCGGKIIEHKSARWGKDERGIYKWIS